MKKILIGLIFLPGIILGQTLSGTITYEIKYVMNPQEKTQMEKYGMSLPSQMEILANGNSAKMKMSGKTGVLMEILHQQSNSYVLDAKNKKAYKMGERPAGKNAGNAKVTKTEEFETIAGHKSRKYIVESPGKKETIWATPDYKLTPEMLANINRRGPGENSYMKSLDGVPLKIVTEERGNTFEMIATSVNESKPDDSNFRIPSDYTEEPFNPAVMGSMMGGGPPARH